MPDASALPESSFTVTPLSDAGGAEVGGIDLRRPSSDATADALRQAWQDHLVLVIRDQEITEEQQGRFCTLFGDLAGLRSNVTAGRKPGSTEP